MCSENKRITIVLVSALNRFLKTVEQKSKARHSKTVHQKSWHVSPILLTSLRLVSEQNVLKKNGFLRSSLQKSSYSTSRYIEQFCRKFETCQTKVMAYKFKMVDLTRKCFKQELFIEIFPTREFL